MKLRFSKMHGLGNDFVVFNGVRQDVVLSPDQIRALADRHYGVGCDQVLLVEASDKADFRYRIFNVDGSEAEQCGNGARCFAQFLQRQGLTDKDHISVETNTGLIHLEVLADGQVSVDMGRPWLQPKDIPLQAAESAPAYPIDVDGQELQIGAASMGNPHAVLQVADVDTTAVATLGPLLSSHARFPEGCNAGFMQIMAPNHIRLRVFERSVGETLACGSGACAAVVVGRVQGHLAEQVKVDVRGGSLTIKWPNEGAAVQMTGPAAHVFEGEIEL